MNKALTPQEAILRFKAEVPEKVIECWNTLIVANMKVQNGNPTSRFEQEELLLKIATTMNITRDIVKERGWLDLEDLFRDKGWKVEYDSPGYNESGKAHYKFRVQ